VAPPDQFQDSVAADIARPARDQDIHAFALPAILSQLYHNVLQN